MRFFLLIEVAEKSCVDFSNLEIYLCIINVTYVDEHTMPSSKGEEDQHKKRCWGIYLIREACMRSLEIRTVKTDLPRDSLTPLSTMRSENTTEFFLSWLIGKSKKSKSNNHFLYEQTLLLIDDFWIQFVTINFKIFSW